MIIRTTTISILAGACLLVMASACNNAAKSTDSGSAVATTAASAEHQHNHTPATKEPANIIPPFNFYILKSGIRFTNADLSETGNRVFIFFDPTCGHCQQEANAIGDHYDQVKSAHFYFVSMNDPALMASFLETWAKPLVGKENVTVLYDRDAAFINSFHLPSQYPATYIYGADGQLKEYWNGERPIAEIISAIKK